MKKIYPLIFLFISSEILAGDLIYLNGFENTALVSGIVSGITGSGLQLKLVSELTNDSLAIDSDGNFVFSLPIAIGDNWKVNTIALPDSPQQSCTLTNSSGVMPASGIDNLVVTCNNTPWKWDVMDWDAGGWQ